jgi:hypothetical protein
MGQFYFFALVQALILCAVGLDIAEARQMRFHCCEQFGFLRITFAVSSGRSRIHSGSTRLFHRCVTQGQLENYTSESEASQDVPLLLREVRCDSGEEAV